MPPTLTLPRKGGREQNEFSTGPNDPFIRPKEGRMNVTTHACGAHKALNDPHNNLDVKPYDLSGLKTYDLISRPSKVFHEDLGKPVGPNNTIDEWFASLPQQ